MDASTQNFGLKNINQWTLVSFALIGFIVGYGLNQVIGAQAPSGGTVAVNQPSAPNPTPVAPSPAGVPVANAADADDDAFLGEKDAPVTVIEFTDYQCPFCARHFTQTLDQIKKEYIDTGKVKYVVRDFPLSSIHPFAQKASEATECAEDQGKFWEMHDMVFQNQQSLDDASLKKYAADLKLSTETFNACLDDGKYAEEVQKDFADGSASGITGTPGFFINDKRVSGALPFASFKAAIDAELK